MRCDMYVPIVLKVPTAIRPALQDHIQPVVASAPSSQTGPAKASSSSAMKEDEPDIDTTKRARDEMDEDIDTEGVRVAPASDPNAGPIRKKIRANDDDDDEDAIVYYFPKEGLVGSLRPWSAQTAVQSASYPLNGFSYETKNTIKVKLRVPEESKGWAFNITPLSDVFSTNIYFHFNPRKKKIHMNHKHATWGDELKIGLGDHRETNDIKAQDIILKIVIHREGFLVFANDIFTAFFPHRTPEKTLDTNLKIDFPTEDSNGKRYDVRVNQVWWGCCEDGHVDDLLTPDIRLTMDAANDTKKTLQNVVSPMAPRTIIIRNFVRTDDLYALQDIEFLIIDTLEDQLGKETMGSVSISLVRGGRFGYARFETREIAQRAADVINGLDEIDDEDSGMSFKLKASLVKVEEIGHESEFTEE